MTTLRQIAEKYGARSKYGNVRNKTLGTDSNMELRGFGELQIRERLGEISDLKLHPRFPIVWPGKDKPFTVYEADASYIEGGRLVVVDWKGHMTPVSNIKIKLMREAFGIEVTVIKKVRR